MSTSGPAGHSPDVLDNAAKTNLLQAYFDEFPETRYDQGARILPDDTSWEAAFTEAVAASPSTTEQQTRIAFILGGGFLFSVAPELVDRSKLGIDVAVVADDNSFLFDWLDHSKDVLAEAETPQEFTETVWDTQNFMCAGMQTAWQANHQSPVQHPVHEWLAAEAESAGAYHFLGSQERFEQCKDAMEQLKCANVVMTLDSLERAGSFAAVLRRPEINGMITYASIGNLYEKHGMRLRETMTRLPFDPQVSINYSSSVRPNADTGYWTLLGQPAAKHTSGIVDYLYGAHNEIIARRTLRKHQR